MKKVLLVLIAWVAISKGFTQVTYQVGFGHNSFLYDNWERSAQSGFSMSFEFQKQVNDRLYLGSGLVLNSNKEKTYYYSMVKDNIFGDYLRNTGDVTYSSVNYMIPFNLKCDISKGKWFVNASVAFFCDDVYRYHYKFNPTNLESKYVKETGIRPGGLGYGYTVGLEYRATPWAGVFMNMVTTSGIEKHLNSYVNLGICFQTHKSAKKED